MVRLMRSRAFSVFAHLVFASAAIAAGAWWFANASAGTYYGHFTGRFLLRSDDPPDYRIIQVKAETAPGWYQSEPRTFSYQTVHIEVHGNTMGPASITVEFPGPVCILNGQPEPLTVERLTELLRARGTAMEEQAEHLLKMVKSLGDGTCEPAQHHPYHVREPYDASFTHFCLGRPARIHPNTVIAVLLAWLGTSIVLCTAKRGQSRR